MGQSVFDYETKTFLSILAISLIGIAIVVSQQQITSNAFFAANLFKKAPTNTFIIKNVDIGALIGKDFPVLTKGELKSLESGTIRRTKLCLHKSFQEACQELMPIPYTSKLTFN